MESHCWVLDRFEERVSSIFHNLATDKDFCDVVLACEGKQVPSHKIVLSAVSPILSDILKQNPHPNPFVYLRGVKYEQLVSLLEFIYKGEVTILQDQVEDFIDVANELQIDGLSLKEEQQENTDNFNKVETNSLTYPKKSFKRKEQDDLEYSCENDEVEKYQKNTKKRKQEHSASSSSDKKINNSPLKRHKNEKESVPSYELLRTERSKVSQENSPGMLTTHDAFIYHFIKWNVDRSIAYYRCSEKSTCHATAILIKNVHLEEENGQLVENFTLTKWGSPDEHTHQGDNTRIMCERIILEMTRKAQKEPDMAIKKVHDEVLESYQVKVDDDETWAVILSSLGKKESRIRRLSKMRAAYLGKTSNI